MDEEVCTSMANFGFVLEFPEPSSVARLGRSRGQLTDKSCMVVAIMDDWQG